MRGAAVALDVGGDDVAVQRQELHAEVDLMAEHVGGAVQLSVLCQPDVGHGLEGLEVNVVKLPLLLVHLLGLHVGQARFGIVDHVRFLL